MRIANREEIINRLFFIAANSSPCKIPTPEQPWSRNVKSLAGKLSLGKNILNSCPYYLPFNKLYRLILHYRTKTLKKILNGLPLGLTKQLRKKLKTFFTNFKAATAASHSNRTSPFFAIACMVNRRPRPVRFVRI